MRGSSRNGSGNTQFFCESCGAEVPGNSDTCPNCGKRFVSVLCPSCGFTGEEALFRAGCPACGYSLSQTGAADSARNGARSRGNLPKDRSDKAQPADALPFWAYMLTVAVFTAVMAAIFFSVFK